MPTSKPKKFDLQTRLASIRKFAEKNHTRNGFRDDYLLRLYRVMRAYRHLGGPKKLKASLTLISKEQKSRKFARAERSLVELTAPQLETGHKSRLAGVLQVLVKRGCPITHVHMVLAELGGVDKAYRVGAGKRRRGKRPARATVPKVRSKRPSKVDPDWV